MFKSREINFTIDNVKGELTFVQSIFGVSKLYQNKELLKSQSKFVSKYLVETNSGTQEELVISQNVKLTYIAYFQGNETAIEEQFTFIEYLIGVIPILFLFYTGGVPGALIGLLSTPFNYKLIKGKEISHQLVTSLVVTLIAFVIYLLLVYLYYISTGNLILKL